MLYNHIFNVLTASIQYSGVERTLSLDDKINVEFGLVDVVPFLVIGDPGKTELTLDDTLDLGFLKDMEGSLSLDDAKI